MNPRPVYAAARRLTASLFLRVFLGSVVPAADAQPFRPAEAPARWNAGAGELRLGLAQSADGIALTSLRDVTAGEELLGAIPPPLFQLALRHATSGEQRLLKATDGWRRTALRPRAGGVNLRWSEPSDGAVGDIVVRATARPDGQRDAWRWRLFIQNATRAWTITEVVFPLLAVTDLGAEAAVVFPRGPGEVQRGIWNRAFSYRGNYPGGWCSMQFVGAYRAAARSSGLYVGLHDPWGGTKDIEVQSDPATRTVQFRYRHPAPDTGVANNDFTLSGEAVWQLLRGDWYDAARIYRDWVRQEARWWPRLSRDGRRDTAGWMRALDVWAMTGGATNECVAAVQAFQQYLALPIGFHWYKWHQIPFDNDYPHYFPAKPGFAAGVAELQRSGIHVMPYINGRLWDSHDRGAQDLEFTRRALPAATKKADGTPYLESYGSKETNGEPVRLAAMCPSTALWQQTVSALVLQLLQDQGTKAVYIDQVAAAAPTLCMDSGHGHPLGGGHWWNEGYWRMLEGIRRAMPVGSMLTTECNGEPFVRWFDGYLTWHWQHDGQVPAFPAVYGGAIQMFGRAYRGGQTKDLALRMKAAQQLVFGEQLGWLDPQLVREPENAAFFRYLAQLRSQLHRYFSAGEMARPPRLSGDIPKLRADWQWSGEWWVTTDAVLTGAWCLPRDRRLVALFVNAGDTPVRATVALDLTLYHVRPAALRRRQLDPEGRIGPDQTTGASWAADFPPRHAEAWEFRW